MILFSFCLSLYSCGDKNDEDSLYYKLMTALGFDMNDYESEQMVRMLDADDEEYKNIAAIIKILLIDNADITPFENSREASSGNCDAILNYMLNNSYAAYSGNAELLADAENEYPQYSITTLIPKTDYEGCVYRYFGGDSSVVHESSVRFIYLPKVGAYTTTGQPAPVTAEIWISMCCETANTYRITFTVGDAEGKSRGYTAMMMKREDGTIYMKYLRAAEETE